MNERVSDRSYDWRTPAGLTLATLMLSLNACAPSDDYQKQSPVPTPTGSTETSDVPAVEIEPIEAPSPTDIPTEGYYVETSPADTTTSPEPSPQPTETEAPVEPSTTPAPTEDPTTPADINELTGLMPPEHSQTVDCMVQKCIALTFDDGPGPYTEDLIDHLAEYDAKATFFLVGDRVDNYETVVTDLRDGGHQIGNHTWDHDDLTTKTNQEAIDDIDQTSDEIEAVTGVRPEVMRPPYGATNQRIVDALGQPQILWSVDTQDWLYRDSDYVSSYVLQHASRGDIVLMHDIHKTSVDAVPEILAELTEQGYVFVTVDDLLGSDLEPGRYSQQEL